VSHREALAETKRGYKQAEEEVATIGREFTAKKNAMKEMKALAEKEAPLEDEDGNPLPLKAELEALTVTSLAETEAAMEEASAKVNGIDANPEVIRQYEERKKEIELIRGQLSELTDSKESKVNELTKARAPWEQALDAAVHEVNALFSKYMQDLSCAGEVKLKKGDGDRRRGDDDDSSDTGNFKDWGIEIRVRFREGSKLQALSARVQSGGERSVSTIMYVRMCGVVCCLLICVCSAVKGERAQFSLVVLTSLAWH
jgi:chromosome segregation ATPase